MALEALEKRTLSRRRISPLGRNGAQRFADREDV
jgi:hypothetical protein